MYIIGDCFDCFRFTSSPAGHLIPLSASATEFAAVGQRDIIITVTGDGGATEPTPYFRTVGCTATMSANYLLAAPREVHHHPQLQPPHSFIVVPACCAVVSLLCRTG